MKLFQIDWKKVKVTKVINRTQTVMPTMKENNVRYQDRIVRSGASCAQPGL